MRDYVARLPLFTIFLICMIIFPLHVAFVTLNSFLSSPKGKR